MAVLQEFTAIVGTFECRGKANSVHEAARLAVLSGMPDDALKYTMMEVREGSKQEGLWFEIQDLLDEMVGDGTLEVSQCDNQRTYRPADANAHG